MGTYRHQPVGQRSAAEMSFLDRLDAWLVGRRGRRERGWSRPRAGTCAKKAHKESRRRKWREFSKLLCAVMSVVMVLVGVWMIREYYRLVELAITLNSAVMPDAQLPIAGVTCILAPMASYLLYQLGLKTSRNKYGVDPDGQPFCRTPDGMDVPYQEEDSPGGEG